MRRRKIGRIAREKNSSREGAFCIRKGKKRGERCERTRVDVQRSMIERCARKTSRVSKYESHTIVEILLS